VYVKVGVPRKGARALERALVISERGYGPVHSRVAVVLKDLGSLYLHIGHLREGQQMLAISKSSADKLFRR